jgi:hypothetical protein
MSRWHRLYTFTLEFWVVCSLSFKNTPTNLSYLEVEEKVCMWFSPTVSSDTSNSARPTPDYQTSENIGTQPIPLRCSRSFHGIWADIFVQCIWYVVNMDHRPREYPSVSAITVSRLRSGHCSIQSSHTVIPLVGYSILTTDGNSWAHHRAMMRRNFAKTQLGNLEIFEKHFVNFLGCIPSGDSIVEVRDLLKKLTMNISTDFILGCSTNSLT